MTSREAQQAAFNKWYDSIYKGIAYTLKDDMESAWQAGREALLAEIKAEPLVRVIAVGQCEFPHLEWLSADHSLRYTPMYLLYRLPEGEQR